MIKETVIYVYFPGAIRVDEKIYVIIIIIAENILNKLRKFCEGIPKIAQK